MSIIVIANPSINEEGIPGQIFSRDVREALAFEYDFRHRPHAKEPPSKALQLGITVNPKICASTEQYGGIVNSRFVWYFFIEGNDFALLLEGSNTKCEIPFKLWTKPRIESRG